MMKTKQKGAARSDGSNKKSNKQQPKSSRHRLTEAHQRKQQPTNRVDDSNSDRGRGRGRQTEWEIYCASLTEERVLELGLEFVNYDKYHQDMVKMETNQSKLRKLQFY